MRYWPVPSLTTLRVFSMSTELDASTVTPGRTAADVSRTTPASVAWANTRLGASRMPASAATKVPTRRILHLQNFVGRKTITHAPSLPRKAARRCTTSDPIDHPAGGGGEAGRQRVAAFERDAL